MRPLAFVVREYSRSLARSPALSISSVFSSPMPRILRHDGTRGIGHVRNDEYDIRGTSCRPPARSFVAAATIGQLERLFGHGLSLAQTTTAEAAIYRPTWSFVAVDTSAPGIHA